MAALRSISTRAAIAATSFTNHYEWGDLKANPSKLLEKYFDAFVDIANWGTREFHIRLPQGSVVYQLLKAMVPGESLRVRKTATFVPGQLWTEGKRHSGRVGYTRVVQKRIWRKLIRIEVNKDRSTNLCTGRFGSVLCLE